jgi:3-oxoacyl-[acyl-carrier protein] reductase
MASQGAIAQLRKGEIMATEKKVAIVTGASKGIGAGIAKALAAEGYVVVVNYASSKTDADKVVGEIERAGGKALAIHADVSKQAEIKQLFSETLKAFGYLNVLINNAAVYGPSPLDAITEEHFHWMFNVNVLGLTFATQEAVKAFGDNGGSIVNVGSTVTRIPSPGFSIYSATKAAVESLTKDWAHELGKKNIRVNALLPGMVDTEGARTLGRPGSEAEKLTIARTPLGRTGYPEDIAPLAVFLASDKSLWITGELIAASGGA